MTRFGLDSTGEVSPAAHHAVGSTVALRYLSRYTPKVVTRSEHEDYKRNGIDLCLVFEDSGRPDLRGYDGGRSDAEFALQQASSILGAPASPLCVTFAADADISGESCDPYYDGVASVMGRDRSGPYGGKNVVSRQADRGFKTLWQTYAWSAGQFDSRAKLYQYSNDHVVGGVGVDFNHIYGDDFGQVDRVPPPPPDPYHYRWFPADRFAWKGRLLLPERSVVMEYDQLRRHPFVHRPRLHFLRGELKDLADHCYFEGRKKGMATWGLITPATWNVDHRGWRYQQLIHRYQGQRVGP